MLSRRYSKQIGVLLSQLQSYEERSLPVPIVLGDFINALGIVRALGEIGISSVVASSSKGVAAWSRWSTHWPVANPVHAREAFIADLVGLGRTLGRRGVIYATKDEFLVAVLDNRDELAMWFDIPWAPDEVMRLCLSKGATVAAASRARVRAPRTFSVANAGELLCLKPNLGWPLILKPDQVSGFRLPLGWKSRNRILSGPEALEEAANELITSGVEVPLVVQEFISGDASSLWTLSSFSDSSGRVVAYSTGHKIRQWPLEAGTISSGRVKPHEAIASLGIRLLDEIGYVGIANTEFKVGSDGTAWLMEINARPGMWNSSTARTGVPLVLYSYMDVVGEPFQGPPTSPTSVSWVFYEADIRAWWSQHPHCSTITSVMRIAEWLKSLPSPRMNALWSVTDPLPTLRLWLGFSRQSLGKLRRTLVMIGAKR